MLRFSWAAILFFWLCTSALAQPIGENWPCWRGPRGDGTSYESFPPPRKWNGTTGENIVWKSPVPGKGHSSPIVYDDRVFLTSCLEDRESRVLLCYERTTGKQLWMKDVVKAPLEKKHDLNSFASSTPACDGERMFAAFLVPEFSSTVDRTPGEMVVVAYDLEGREQWRVKPGKFASVHGFCSSPVLFENLVIVNGDHDGDSYIVALSKPTGEEVWRIKRENNTRSYVTPIIRTFNDRLQMILSGTKMVASYDPRTGHEYWRMQGPTEQFVASPVSNGKLVFLTAGFPDHHILSIDPTGEGDVTQTHIVWRTQKNCSYVPSPVMCRVDAPFGLELPPKSYLLVVADGGVATCFEPESGKVWWRERLGPHYSASLMSTSGLVYFTSDEGVTKVVRVGDTLEIVGENPLGQSVYASPAKSRGQLFLRGESDLFCIGGK